MVFTTERMFRRVRGKEKGQKENKYSMMYVNKQIVFYKQSRVFSRRGKDGDSCIKRPEFCFVQGTGVS